jgi:hypothetical protein
MYNITEMAVKLVGSGVGLGREAYLYRKEKKRASKLAAAQSATAGSRSLDKRGFESQAREMDDEEEEEEKERRFREFSENDANEPIANDRGIPPTDEEKAQLQKKWEDMDDEADGDEMERYWALDDASNLPPSYEQAMAQQIPDNANLSSPEINSFVSIPKLVENIVALAPNMPLQIIPMPYPVIIPQRRPRSKGRGFVRAYAPDLMSSGISEEMFLRFLNNFDQAARASPYIVALYYAAGVAGLVPGVIPTVVSIAVQFAAGTAMELQNRYRANSYLDLINKDVFMPRGLYAMVLRYRPDKKNTGNTEFGLEELDWETVKNVTRGMPSTVPGQETGPASKTGRILQRIRIHSGTTREGQIPMMVAPLVFPGVPESVAMYEAGDENQNPNKPKSKGFKAKMKSAQNFVSDYYDRRAQAEYIAKNPDSVLARQAPAPTFRSRFADPTHASNNGHPVNLLTGGLVNLPTMASRVKEQRKMMEAQRVAMGLPAKDITQMVLDLAVKGVKKVFVGDVLYLIVVNMPSERELAEARAFLLQNGWNK